MKKTLILNEQEYILLEMLYLMDYFNFDSEVAEKLREFKNYMEERIYKDTFDSGKDILDSSLILEYEFE